MNFSITRRGAHVAQLAPQPAPPPAPPSGPAAELAAPSGPPSPLEVFCSFLAAKQTPPDPVIVFASAEAEMLGNSELARQIADRYPEVMARRAEIVASFAASSPTSEAAPAAPTEAAAPVDDTGLPVLTPSPIEGVSDDQWRALCQRLVRAPSSYNSERRIGRFHHRKDRLREIGFDPDSLTGSADAQDVALSADLADVFRHLDASGELAKQVGRPIVIPDQPDPIVITLSGLFGVASVAGLEDMAEWLSSKSDRKKFPYTTAAFLRANGIF